MTNAQVALIAAALSRPGSSWQVMGLANIYLEWLEAAPHNRDHGEEEDDEQEEEEGAPHE